MSERVCKKCGLKLPAGRKKFCCLECMRSYDTLPERFWAKVRKSETCWVWRGAVDFDGYGMIQASVPSTRTLRAQRVSWELNVGPIPEGLVILHLCDNKRCVNPAHLRPGTSGENTRDAADKGRMADGVRNAAAKLTRRQVAEIRRLYDAKLATQVQLAERFGMSQSQISAIVRRESWT
jgi:hypothetical protein